MKHTSGNGLFLKMMLIGVIALVIFSGLGRYVVEDYSEQIQKKIQMTIEMKIEEFFNNL